MTSYKRTRSSGASWTSTSRCRSKSGCTTNPPPYSCTFWAPPEKVACATWATTPLLSPCRDASLRSPSASPRPRRTRMPGDPAQTAPESGSFEYEGVYIAPQTEFVFTSAQRLRKMRLDGGYKPDLGRHRFRESECPRRQPSPSRQSIRLFSPHPLKTTLKGSAATI